MIILTVYCIVLFFKKKKYLNAWYKGHCAKQEWEDSHSEFACSFGCVWAQPEWIRIERLKSYKTKKMHLALI